ncbi:MAG: NAD kinase [Actinomycetaceae bacterium]|nr:NAD kinase [Actinomycetaceae bacterium]
MTRTIGVLSHDRHDKIIESAREVVKLIENAGLNARWLPEGPVDQTELELVVVIGGDGTILRAVESCYETEVPILGINYGRVGFLAEAEPSGLPDVINSIKNRDWTVDSRMTVRVQVERRDGSYEESWALNEASIEKGPQARMIETDIGVDKRPLSSFKCDTVLVSTPTGSTAYSFSAGGPVVWPNVEAMVLTPVAAHALFARPLVVGPESELTVDMRAEDAVVWLDGRRTIDAPEGSRITVTRGEHRVLLARLNDTPFSGRLVRKFNLPVNGWCRGRND